MSVGHIPLWMSPDPVPTSPKSPQFNAIYDHRFDSPHPFRIHCSNFHFVLLLWVVEFTSMLPPALSPLLILFPSLFSSPTFLPTLYRLLSSPLLKIRKLFLLGFLVKSFFLFYAPCMFTRLVYVCTRCLECCLCWQCCISFLSFGVF